MASRCRNQRNDVASVVLNQNQNENENHFRLWSSFSAASFRRKLISAVICGSACSPVASTTKSNKKPDLEPKLIDLLNLSDSSKDEEEALEEEEEEEETEEVVKRKEERLAEMTAAARKLQSDIPEERRNGAKLIRKMAKEDGESRSILAMMGVIPPLIAMIRVYDDLLGETESQIDALYALLNLGIGNDLNKAAIVEAGAVRTMLDKIQSSPNDSLDSSVSEAIVANLLSLSALDSNKPIIGSLGAIPFLVNTLQISDTKKCNHQARHDTLRALYNLSISPSNISSIIPTDLISYLVVSLGDMEVSERILAILSNVLTTSEGRRAISNVPDVFPTLIDVLNWTDSPACQEKASYILMVMSHKSYSDKQRMVEAGIGPALLELTLLGSTLAQKRASRTLECLRVNVNVSTAVSAPIYGSSASRNVNSEKEEEMMTMSDEKKAVRQLVQQSLQDNMRRIVKRANLHQDFVPSERLKSLTLGSTSKSLPF